MSTTTKEYCVDILNRYLKTQNVQSIYEILLYGSNDIDNKEYYIKELISSNVVLLSWCIEIAIKNICTKYNIITLTNNNQTILFY